MSQGANDDDYDLVEENQRRLRYVIDRPTPMNRNVKENEIDSQKKIKLSIVKQSLLFKDGDARESIFKIAETVNLGLDHYISNQQDLELVNRLLPK